VLIRQIFSVLILSSCCLAPVFAEGAYARRSADGKAAVASVNPLATQAGIDALEKGGNAVDAALAMAFMLGVVDSHNSGIGGGCFILAHLADGRIVALDGREMAPAKAHRDMYIHNGELQPNLSREGALAAGVPGSVAVYYELQRIAGKLDFSDVILPAAQVAENGFAIDKVMAARLQRTQASLEKFPSTAHIFVPEGKLLVEGEQLVQKDLALTYRKLAEQGPSYFYRGEFAQQVNDWMRENGGILSLEDLAAYKAFYRQPIKTQFMGYQVYGFPSPSSGGVHVAQILGMLELLGFAQQNEEQRYHSLIEVHKRAFADRAHWMGDTDFVDVPRNLISTEYLKSRVATISDRAVTHSVTFGLPENAERELFDRHTTHLTAADQEGNWVAITTTLNTSFGSKVVIPGTGVLLNNQMDDFVAQPGQPNAFGLVGSEANRIEPGKRPLSSMSPVIVLKDGQPVLTAGAAGGPTIISQVAQTLVNVLALEMPIKQAMLRARIHHQWKPDMVFIDGYAAQELQAALEARGHKLKDWPRFGGTQAISLENGRLQPQSEPRIIYENPQSQIE
jgi:gamma-glutamyltranspeptidase/glutathione hydrolase